jgi:Nucleotidyl transferase AbiEii toxin, Type IV TA system
MDQTSFERALELLKSLSDNDVDYILVGGLALSFHGLVRGTEDIDIFLDPTEENVSKLKAALGKVWDDPAVEEINQADLAGDYPTVRYGPPEDVFFVDILARLGEAFSYSDLEAEVKIFRGIPVRVATPKTLYRMKKDTVRGKDKVDAEALRQTFPEVEEN